MKKIALFVCAVVLSGSVGVYAGTNIENITAQINYATKIKINGNEYKPVDNVTGAALKPITYKGRTYVPLRSIGEAFGVAVDYDAQESTVILGTREGKGLPAEQLATKPAIETNGNNGRCGFTKDKELLAVNGKTYDEGYFFTDINDGRMYGAEVKFATGKRYQKLTFEASATANNDVKIEVLDGDPLNGTVLKSVVLTAGAEPQTIEADIGTSDTVYLKLFANTVNTHPNAVLGEVYFK